MIRSQLFFAIVLLTSALAQQPTYKYIRIGSPTDVTTKATAGYALMGGGDDLDEAFKFLCEKSGGGDFLVMRAAGDDDYNDYINKLCKVNSVATLIIPDRDSAADPKVADIIRHAEAVLAAIGAINKVARFGT